MALWDGGGRTNLAQLQEKGAEPAASAGLLPQSSGPGGGSAQSCRVTACEELEVHGGPARLANLSMCVLRNVDVRQLMTERCVCGRWIRCWEVVSLFFSVTFSVWRIGRLFLPGLSVLFQGV